MGHGAVQRAHEDSGDGVRTGHASPSKPHGYIWILEYIYKYIYIDIDIEYIYIYILESIYIWILGSRCKIGKRRKGDQLKEREIFTPRFLSQ